MKSSTLNWTFCFKPKQLKPTLAFGAAAVEEEAAAGGKCAFCDNVDVDDHDDARG